MSKRWKRKSGWVYPDVCIEASKKYIIENCLEPQKFYNDWVDWRDGFRDIFKDGKLIRKINYHYCRWCNNESYLLRKELNIRNKMLVRRRKLK